MNDTLWPDLIPPEPVQAEQMSAGRRLTARQRRDVERGRHPLMGGPISGDPDAKCGNCRFRVPYGYHRRSYPKCEMGPIAHSTQTDVRAWWPGCQRHEYGDPKLSPDAARSGPQR